MLGGAGRFAYTAAGCALLLFAVIAASVSIGSVSIGLSKVWSMLGKGLSLFVRSVFSKAASEELSALIASSGESSILFRIRLPRTLLAAILGGSLSVSGYLLQVFFRNPIAGPFVLGISSGAKMVVGLVLIFFAGRIGLISSLTLVAAAFGGSLLITLLVLLFSQRVRNMSMLLVVGIMVGYICSAVTEFCITFAADHDV
ncbi:MAG: iron chelate uptake ABC transporter family permease subunit, partial [Firmicutes bacterium]|nr:iron chelate uptake ABC transporter family permease subunit [Bacillota bacterium]